MYILQLVMLLAISDFISKELSWEQSYGVSLQPGYLRSKLVLEKTIIRGHLNMTTNHKFIKMSVSLFYISSFLLIWMTIGIVVGDTSESSDKRPNKPWLGAYIWGGLLNGNSSSQRLDKTLQAVLDHGIDTVRVSIGPTALEGADLSKQCSPPKDNLRCYAEQVFASDKWNDIRLKRIILTAIDRTCVRAEKGNNGCLDLPALQKLEGSILAEYKDFLIFLNDRFKNRNIKFILSDWEGDNFILCGSAYRFARDVEYAKRCLSTWPANQSITERAYAHSYWIKLRDDALSRFNIQFPEFFFVQAPEFNDMQIFKDHCLSFCSFDKETVFRSLETQGRRGYCSYSMYDSLNLNKDRIIENIMEIKKTCAALVIGEVGFDYKKSREIGSYAKDFYNLINELQKDDIIEGVVVWNAANPDDDSQRFGLFERNGTLQAIVDLSPLLKRNNIAP